MARKAYMPSFGAESRAAIERLPVGHRRGGGDRVLVEVAGKECLQGVRDKDTKDEPGFIKIFDTILEKIEKATVFVTDDAEKKASGDLSKAFADGLI